MKQENTNIGGGGLGFGRALALLFIGFTLGGIVDWSWLWVLSPLWIPLALVLAILVCVLGVVVVSEVYKKCSG